MKLLLISDSVYFIGLILQQTLSAGLYPWLNTTPWDARKGIHGVCQNFNRWGQVHSKLAIGKERTIERSRTRPVFSNCCLFCALLHITCHQLHAHWGSKLFTENWKKYSAYVWDLSQLSHYLSVQKQSEQGSSESMLIVKQIPYYETFNHVRVKCYLEAFWETH